MKRLICTLLLLLAPLAWAQEEEFPDDSRWEGPGHYQVNYDQSTTIETIYLHLKEDGTFRLGFTLPGDGLMLKGTYQDFGGGQVLEITGGFDDSGVAGRALLMRGQDGAPSALQGYFNYPKGKSLHAFSFPSRIAVGEGVDKAHNAENSLDWAGTYKGVLPCADCQGIETTLTLNKDYTYLLQRKYLGKNIKASTKRGSFRFDANGSVAKLAGVEGADQFFVSEGYVSQLGLDGRPILGALARQYQMTKLTEAVSLRGTRWLLTELGGQSITELKTDESLTPSLLFDESDGVSGNGSCNSFSGSYTLQGETRLRFSEFLSTRKTCPDQKLEDAYFQALRSTDSFSLQGDELQLFRARMAPLARFKRVTR